MEKFDGERKQRRKAVSLTSLTCNHAKFFFKQHFRAFLSDHPAGLHVSYRHEYEESTLSW